MPEGDVDMLAGALKVLVYDSVSGTDQLNLGTSKGKTLSARDFAAADIVLTTYETLQKDVHHQSDVKSYRLRHAKKYEVRSRQICVTPPLLPASSHSTLRNIEIGLLRIEIALIVICLCIPIYGIQQS